MPLADALLDTLGHRRVAVVLVEQGQVVEDRLVFGVHPLEAVLRHHRQLVAEGRVVGRQLGTVDETDGCARPGAAAPRR